MAGNANSSWDKIQQGVKETERLIGQREYNASMIKARQTLEFMVKHLADMAGILDERDLKNMIDALYENHWISKDACEHYHKIRMIGNKAVHEGDANAYSANQAYHMLSQEVYTFADDYRNKKKMTKTTKTAKTATTRSRKRSKSKNTTLSIYNLLKLLVPVLCVVLLILVIKLVKPESRKHETEGSTAVETMASVEETETEEAEPVYRTTDVLNVRPEPNTTSNRIGQLEAGVEVEYVRAYDADWAVILYNGQEAYVASQYLTVE